MNLHIMDIDELRAAHSAAERAVAEADELGEALDRAEAEFERLDKELGRRMREEDECTCRYFGLGGNDPDGYVKLDRWCPVHGQDPDDARDAKMERDIWA